MHIEEVLLLAKGARGKSLCDLIVKATSDPGIYEFGELVELPAAKEVSFPALFSRVLLRTPAIMTYVHAI